jgi:hypothetical protein
MLPGDEATNAITEKIIGCPFRVRDKLKCGFLEKVYENAERRIRPRATKKRPRTYLTDRPATRTRRNFSHGRAGQTRTVNSIRQKSTKLSASPLFWVLPEIRARPQKWISQLHYSLAGPFDAVRSHGLETRRTARNSCDPTTATRLPARERRGQ